ncbi:hypothetical protein BKI52_25090 [marine bacterium AO1-C]|nr:hypothetical protein BKI52_25090 [marine bacterium AO1-C]
MWFLSIKRRRLSNTLNKKEAFLIYWESLFYCKILENTTVIKQTYMGIASKCLLVRLDNEYYFQINCFQ